MKSLAKDLIVIRYNATKLFIAIVRLFHQNNMNFNTFFLFFTFPFILSMDQIIKMVFQMKCKKEKHTKEKKTKQNLTTSWLFGGSVGNRSNGTKTFYC